MAGAPFGALGPEAASVIQEPEGSGWRFYGKQLDATRVDQIVVMAVMRPFVIVASFSKAIMELSVGPVSRAANDRQSTPATGGLQATGRKLSGRALGRRCYRVAGGLSGDSGQAAE